MKHSKSQSSNKLLLLLAFLLAFTTVKAQILQQNSIELGRTFYYFPKWKHSFAQELTIGSIYYSHKTTIRNKNVRWAVDANLLVGILTTGTNPTNKVVERRLFLSNVCIGKDVLARNKKHDLYLNTGIALRAGFEYFLFQKLDFEGDGEEKILWLPGLNFSTDYIYHISKNLVFHPFAGVNVFAERTYAYSYAGLNVGWAFGKK
jgi:hypothetical protein